MAWCECCWSASAIRRRFGPDADTAYSDVLRQHEERGCVCTQETLEGRRAAAGQWWDEGRQMDSRDLATERGDG